VCPKRAASTLDRGRAAHGSLQRAAVLVHGAADGRSRLAAERRHAAGLHPSTVPSGVRDALTPVPAAERGLGARLAARRVALRNKSNHHQPLNKHLIDIHV
jgi:hypothetical protein